MTSATNSLDLFELYLSEEKELGQETVNKHLNNLHFFMDAYLNRTGEISLTDVSDDEITDFLGNFYIRKVLGGTKSELLSFIPSFKKYFRFLFEIGEIDEDQYNDIIDACRNPNRYRRRFESYFNIDFDAPDRDERFNRWLMWEENDNYEEYSDYGFKAKFNDQYVQKILQFPENLQNAIEKCPIHPKTTSFLHDFHIFLNYCVKNPTMKVTKTQGFIQRKHIHAINNLFKTPEKLKTTINQPQAKRIHLFYNLVVPFEFFLITSKSTLQSTRVLTVFKKLSTSGQIAWIFYAIWYRIQWKNLLEPHAGGRPEWSQTKRIFFEEAFSDAFVDSQYDYPQYVLQYQQMQYGHNGILDPFLYSWGVIPERILPALEYMGLIRIFDEKKKTQDQKYSYVIINQISISLQGKEVFKAIFDEREQKDENEKISRI